MFVCVYSALQAGSVDDLRSFKSRRQPTRRSARSGTIKGPIDPKGSCFVSRLNCGNRQFKFAVFTIYLFILSSEICSVQNVSATTTVPTTTTTTATCIETAVLRSTPTRIRSVIFGSRVASPGHQQRAATLASVIRCRSHWSARNRQNRVRLATSRTQLFRPSQIQP